MAGENETLSAGQLLTWASCQRGGCVFGASAFARRVPFDLAPRGELIRFEPDQLDGHTALMGIAMSGFDFQQPFVIRRK